jgi:hypothetical protein
VSIDRIRQRIVTRVRGAAPLADRCYERTLPLLDGYAVAAYAVRSPVTLRFAGYAKLFHGPVGTYWDVPHAVRKFASRGEHACGYDAVEDALATGLAWLSRGGLVRHLRLQARLESLRNPAFP